MTDWWVWSSPDLVSWTLADVLYPNATPAPPSDYGNCWATDGAHRKNPATGSWEYFFYMSIGKCQTAVMKSTSGPAGPWDNVLGAPLLNDTLGNSLSPKACFRDPAVFEDEDGSHYIISGVFDYYIMKLGADLVSLAEAPRLVAVHNPTGPYGAKTDDKPFIHKANGLYYLSWGCFYGISASVYGPYIYTGSAIDTDFIAPDFRTNNTQGPWYSHEDYADRHGSFWTAGGQWFYASNDRSHSTDRRNAGVFRDTVVGYVHYFANSTIAPVAINSTGVGAYAAAHIEAENFMRLAGGARKAHLPARGDAFVVAVEDPATAALLYPNVRGAARRGGGALALVAANEGGGAATVTASVGAEKRAAVCSVPPTGGAFVEVRCPLLGRLPADGEAADVLLTFAGAGGRLLLDSFSLGT